MFAPSDLAKLALAIFEIRLFEDCMIDDIIVFDLSNLTLRDMLKVSPKFIIRAFSVYKVRPLWYRKFCTGVVVSERVFVATQDFVLC